MHILLVRPDYPGGPADHHKYAPAGLLKMSSYYKDKGHSTEFIIGNGMAREYPDEVHITTLFTYWRDYSLECVQYYACMYPDVPVFVGGVDASLHPDIYEHMGFMVSAGIRPEVDDYFPDLSYYKDGCTYQILHTTRGCVRHCKFCGTYLVDGYFTYKTTEEVERLIFQNEVIFYDNNIAANPFFKNILIMLANKRVNGKVLKCESKSGFDARLLMNDYVNTIKFGGTWADTPYYLIKQARFISPRIAWDNWVEERETVEKSLELFNMAGYPMKDLQVFMLFNYDLNMEQLEYKRKACQEWGVQISHCRYRPLNQTFDRYNARKPQGENDYYIHPRWSDREVKEFSARVRSQNILIRYLRDKADPVLDLAYLRKVGVRDAVLQEYMGKYKFTRV